jgi:hypothetical protein
MNGKLVRAKCVLRFRRFRIHCYVAAPFLCTVHIKIFKTPLFIRSFSNLFLKNYVSLNSIYFISSCAIFLKIVFISNVKCNVSERLEFAHTLYLEYFVLQS